MVRWLLCSFASVLACTIPNPRFMIAGEDTSSSSSTPVGTTGDATTGATTNASSTGDPGTTLPIDTTGDETTSEPSTTTTTTSSSSSSSSDDTGPAGPCVDICGTPGCGECPPDHMVDYGDFAIDARETANSEYQQFLAAEQSPAIQPPQCAWNDDFTPSIWPVDGKALPVVNIDWCDASAYCAWAGKRLCGAIDGGPAKPSQFIDASANQWYRACSNGEGRGYPYGDDYDPLACNGADAKLDGPTDVGSLPDCEAAVAGVFDLSGNVWEWVDACDGEGPEANCARRGGSFFSDLKDLRCNLLSERPRAEAVSFVGVRCCSM